MTLALSSFKFEITIPEVSKIPDVGEIVQTTDGYKVRVTQATKVNDYVVLVGKLVEKLQNRHDACWMLRHALDC